MIEKFTKAFGIFHWDTFDNETILIGEVDTIEEAQEFVKDRYKDRIRSNGADRVDIVNQNGDIVGNFNVG